MFTGGLAVLGKSVSVPEADADVNLAGGRRPGDVVPRARNVPRGDAVDDQADQTNVKEVKTWHRDSEGDINDDDDEAADPFLYAVN